MAQVGMRASPHMGTGMRHRARAPLWSFQEAVLALQLLRPVFPNWAMSQAWGLSSSPTALAAGPGGRPAVGFPDCPAIREGPVAAPTERRWVVGSGQPLDNHSPLQRSQRNQFFVCLLCNILHARTQTQKTLFGRRTSGRAGALASR